MKRVELDARKMGKSNQAMKEAFDRARAGETAIYLGPNGARLVVMPEATLEAIRSEVAEQKLALQKADEALCAWLHQYAGEFCHEKDVLAYADRIRREGGTLAYIGKVAAIVRKARANGERNSA